MQLARLFNHGILRSIKKDGDKLILEGTIGKEEFTGGSGLPSIGESDAGKVLTVDDGAAKWLPPSGGGGIGSQILNFEVRISDVSDIGSGSFHWDLSDVANTFVTSMLGSPEEGTVVELRNGIIGENMEDGEETYPFATTGIWRDGTQSEFHKALIAEFGMPICFTKSDLTYTVYMTISYDNGTYAFEGAFFNLAAYSS